MNARHQPSILAVAEAPPADSPYAARARYHTPQNGFSFQWAKVPPRQFLAERDRAFDRACATGLVTLDCSDALGTDYPATTPTLLLRYVRLNEGEGVSTALVASGEIYHVLRGRGASRNGTDRIVWGQGDLFCFPGGQFTSHACESEDALLVLCTNEPLLALEGLPSPAPGHARVAATHWPAAEIERHLSGTWRRSMPETPSGQFVQFSSETMAPSRNTLATVSVAINTLPPGWDQPQRRHGGVAVTLALQGQGVHSMVEGQRINWSTGAMHITPASALHSHHNLGTQRMLSLVFQEEAPRC